MKNQKQLQFRNPDYYTEEDIDPTGFNVRPAKKNADDKNQDQDKAEKEKKKREQ